MVDPQSELPGGASGLRVVRVGDTVRRPLHENAPFVHALLRHFEAVGFEGAPRFLGIDEEGREILSYVEGRVYPGPDEVDDPVVILSDEHLVSAGRLIRRFHDATAGTALAGAAEVVCHPDLGQHNIVFMGNDAKAIIDWDEDVAPGPRILDFAHAVWCLAEIGRQGGAIDEQARRARLLCDAYGWDDPPAVIDEIKRGFAARSRGTPRRESLELCASSPTWPTGWNRTGRCSSRSCSVHGGAGVRVTVRS